MKQPVAKPVRQRDIAQNVGQKSCERDRQRGVADDGGPSTRLRLFRHPQLAARRRAHEPHRKHDGAEHFQQEKQPRQERHGGGDQTELIDEEKRNQSVRKRAQGRHDQAPDDDHARHQRERAQQNPQEPRRLRVYPAAAEEGQKQRRSDGRLKNRGSRDDGMLFIDEATSAPARPIKRPRQSQEHRDTQREPRWIALPIRGERGPLRRKRVETFFLQFLRARRKNRAAPERYPVAHEQAVEHVLDRATEGAQHLGDARVLYSHPALDQQGARPLPLHCGAPALELAHHGVDALEDFQRRALLLCGGQSRIPDASELIDLRKVALEIVDTAGQSVVQLGQLAPQAQPLAFETDKRLDGRALAEDLAALAQTPVDLARQPRQLPGDSLGGSVGGQVRLDIAQRGHYRLRLRGDIRQRNGRGGFLGFFRRCRFRRTKPAQSVSTGRRRERRARRLADNR